MKYAKFSSTAVGNLLTFDYSSPRTKFGQVFPRIRPSLNGLLFGNKLERPCYEPTHSKLSSMF